MIVAKYSWYMLIRGTFIEVDFHTGTYIMFFLLLSGHLRVLAFKKTNDTQLSHCRHDVRKIRTCISCVLKSMLRVASLVYISAKLGKIKYVYMCITRSERVCDKGSIKRDWLCIICVRFSLSNSPDIRLLCLIICYLCFWCVFKILFSSIICVL